MIELRTASRRGAARTTALAAAAAAFVGAAALCSFAGNPGAALPPDRGLAVGSLHSGLSWYLRPTERPEDRLVFRLVVAAGSARELEGERGYAHFTEHMAFNGTSAYPGNALDDLLDSLDGGLDLELNAFTYPDCTVYHLELPAVLPPDRGDALALGFRILRQWASELSFDPGEVEREKGVIRAEMREYDSPEELRALREEAALYGGTPLADRGILGTPESVREASAEALRAFYLREYRQERMAVIAAGPFEAPEARRALEEAFADLGGRARPARAPALLPSDKPAAVAVVRDLDERRTRTELRLLFREGARPLRARADWTREYRARLAERVLAGRLADLGADPGVPWIVLGSDRWEERFGERLWELAVSCPAGAEEDTLRALGRELGALRFFGATPGEAETASLEVGLTLPYPDPDAYEAVESAIRRFLYGDVSLDPARADDLEAGLRAGVLDGNAAPPGTLPGDLPEPEGAVLSVSRPGPGGPGDGELAAAFLAGFREGRTGGSAAPLPIRESGIPGAANPADAFPSGSEEDRALPLSRKEGPDGMIDLVLANGIRVRLRATGSGEGWAYLAAWSPGGRQAARVEGSAAAEAPAILARAGHPGRSPGDLRSALAGTWAGWRAGTELREELVEADGNSEDLDLLFRLLAASFRSPVADPGVLRKAAAARAEELRLAAGPEAEFQAALETPSGPAGYRLHPVDLEGWTADDIRAAWTDRFGNSGDFEFLAAGDFDLREAESLALEHLGRLRPSGPREAVPPPPSALAPGFRFIDAGNHPRGRVLVQWSLRDRLPAEVLDLDAFASALELQLFRRLREDRAETYDMSCDWEPYPERPGAGEFRVEFEASPERARGLAGILLEEVAAFSAGYPGPESHRIHAGSAGDEEVYLDLLDGLRAERAGAAAGQPGSFGPESAGGVSAARLLAPESAAVFVLGRD